MFGTARETYVKHIDQEFIFLLGRVKNHFRVPIPERVADLPAFRKTALARVIYIGTDPPTRFESVDVKYMQRTQLKKLDAFIDRVETELSGGEQA